MKPARWNTVAAKLRKQEGLTWAQARVAYRRVAAQSRAETGRAPSLNYIKGKPKLRHHAGRLARAVSRKVPAAPAPLAPRRVVMGRSRNDSAPPGGYVVRGPIEIGYAGTKFQQALSDEGLPATMRSPVYSIVGGLLEDSNVPDSVLRDLAGWVRVMVDDVDNNQGRGGLAKISPDLVRAYARMIDRLNEREDFDQDVLHSLFELLTYTY